MQAYHNEDDFIPSSIFFIHCICNHNTSMKYLILYKLVSYIITCPLSIDHRFSPIPHIKVDVISRFKNMNMEK